MEASIGDLEQQLQELAGWFYQLYLVNAEGASCSTHFMFCATFYLDDSVSFSPSSSTLVLNLTFIRR